MRPLSSQEKISDTFDHAVDLQAETNSLRYIFFKYLHQTRGGEFLPWHTTHIVTSWHFAWRIVSRIREYVSLANPSISLWSPTIEEIRVTSIEAMYVVGAVQWAIRSDLSNTRISRDRRTQEEKRRRVKTRRRNGKATVARGSSRWLKPRGGV